MPAGDHMIIFVALGQWDWRDRTTRGRRLVPEPA